MAKKSAYIEIVADKNEPSIPSPTILTDYLTAGNLVSDWNDQTTFEEIYGQYTAADNSMTDWRESYKKALMLARMQPHIGSTREEFKSFPFEGASVAMMPYILEAMLDFSGRVAPELVWSPQLVKTRIFGDTSEAALQRAARVSDYLNYQLAEEIPHWREDQDKALFSLACVGTFYKDTYYDKDKNTVCSDFIAADEIVFDQKYPTFEKAPAKFRKLTYTRNEIISFIRGESQWDLSVEELPDISEEINSDMDLEFVLAYTWLDLDEDGLQEPYQVILYPEANKLVAIYADFAEETIILSKTNEIIKVDRLPTLTQYKFIPDPGGSPMGIGWGIILGPAFAAINTTIRQLIDAGTLSAVASSSGIISVGTRYEAGPIQVKMGQLTPIPVESLGGGNLSQNIAQLPFAPPNPTTFQLTEFLINSLREMTSSAVASEANANEAAALYLARLQQSMKMPNAIAMRVYNAQRKELKKIALLNYLNEDNDRYNSVLAQDATYNMKMDFNPHDLRLFIAADLSLGNEAERIAKSNTVIQLGLQGRAVGDTSINLREANKLQLEALKFNDKEIEALLPPPQQGPTQEQKLKMAQMQMEAEFKQRDQALRENEQKVQTLKLEQDKQEMKLKHIKIAHDAAKQMSALGLQSEIQEADIANKYANTLKILTEIGMASGLEDGMKDIQQIENKFINKNKLENTKENTDNVDDKGINDKDFQAELKEHT